MIVGIGVDVVDIARLESAMDRTPSMRARLFVGSELGLQLTSLAGTYAAKEALVKAFKGPAGLSWQDIEVVREASGAPSFELSDRASQRAKELGIETLHLSISHDGGMATAFVVAEG
ncbi:MAG: holo-ACP synthase [Nocardioidaceae bacterium]|nr:holo-ACP synthase [Nocardioidaceae bacterium]